jgi:catechol 2,3-dioxygenase-like lactoylglutathione lyase family enzyme
VTPVTTETTQGAAALARTGGSEISRPCWTHIALPSGDLDKSIEFYTSMTPLVVVATREDADGRNAWLSNPGQWETPFVLVLSAFNSAHGTQQGIMKPFAHIGIEVPNREDIDKIADRARATGCLSWEPREMPDPIGYICAVNDPDGNVIEFSHNQRVFSTIRRLWGPETA